MNIKKENINMNTVVDTLQVAIHKDDIENYNIIEADTLGYIKVSDSISSKESCRRIKVSPKHKIGYENTNSRKKLEECTLNIFKEIGVKVENVEINRMDIAIDSSLKYDDYKKFHFFLFELITFKESHKKKIVCTSLDNYKDNNIYLNSRDLKLAIYDKALESEGTHPYNTRIEFRWCRYVSLDTKKSAEKVIHKLKGIEDNYEELVVRTVKYMSELYKEELEKEDVSNFTEFVKRNSKYIYTKDVLEGVYKNAGLKGSFTNWFRKFKTTHSKFAYYSLKDIKVYRDLMVKAVKSYMKS